MTLLTDLIARVRNEFLADDVGVLTGTPRWSDTNITNALNEAQRELVRRCQLIKDGMTPSVCFLPLVADIDGNFPQSLALSSKVIRVRYVLFPRFDTTVNSTAFPFRELSRTSTEYLNNGQDDGHRHGFFGEGFDGSSGGWEWIGRTGHVQQYVTDFQTQSITFDRQPLYGGTVRIGVYRLPLADMTILDPASAPEVKEQDIVLIHGALKYLYSKGYAMEDRETFDPIKEARWRKEFEDDISRVARDIAMMEPKRTICRPERGFW